MKTKKNSIVAILCATLALALVLSVAPVTALAYNETVTEDAQTAALYASYFSGGDGSAANPYLITNESELNHVREVLTYNSEVEEYYIDDCFKVMGDIHLSVYRNWTPIQAYFSGTFDGNGATIHSMNIVASNGQPRDDNYGFFQWIRGGTVKNLNFANVSITYSKTQNVVLDAGAVAGVVEDGTITNCKATGNINMPSYLAWVGGIVGYAVNTTISYCENYVNISGSGLIGGIVGYCRHFSTINNCLNCGNLTYYFNTSSGCIAGIVGKCEYKCDISYCTNGHDTYDLGKIVYGSPSSSNNNIQPCMAQIVGWIIDSTLGFRNLQGFVDYSNLYNNQKTYCSIHAWGRLS